MTTLARRRARRTVLTGAAIAALCALPAAAVGIDTTIRVEGLNETLVPEGRVEIAADGTTSPISNLDYSATWQADTGSAFWQLHRALGPAGVPLDFTVDPQWGPFISQIGPAGPGFWMYKVNNAVAQVGAPAFQLAQSDSVLWYKSAGGSANLDLAVSADRVRTGSSFQVTVVSYDGDGVATPAAGATVAYGSAQATTDAAGQATFIAQSPANIGLRATRTTDVRSATRAVCSFDQDPTVCNLPPAPPAPPTPPTTPTTPSAPGADTVPPGSAIAAPALRGTHRTVRSLTGTAGPDRSDVARVEVALGLRAGTLCRFRTATGTLTAARDCGQPEWLTARTAGTNWVLPLGNRALPPGSWRVESRATDGAGNVESVRVPGVNIGSFRVRDRVVRPTVRITAPKAAATRSGRLVSGTAGPAAADISLVEVAIARRSTGSCRFVTGSGALTAARPCARPVWIAARSAGARWQHRLAAPLSAGSWTVRARATSADGIRSAVVSRGLRIGGGR